MRFHPMKNSIIGLILAIFVAAPLSPFALNAAQAASIPYNSAVRGTSSSAVYWFANDGKRYVFPNASVYFSWFPNFNNVRMISNSEINSFPIGGNVTYRPGANLVKIATDAKVYAVSRGGVLRHVTTPYIASQLFGYNWGSKIMDIPDTYFTNYTVGTPIYSVYDYNVSNEYNGVSTPSDSLRGVSTVTNGSLNDITLNVSRTNINPGEAVLLSVSNLPNYGAGYRVEIYDTRTNGLVRTCAAPFSYSVNDIYATTACTVTVYPQRNGTENSVQYYAALRDNSSTTIKSGYAPVIYFGNVNGVTNTGSITMSLDRTSIYSGDTVNVSAWANSSFNASRIEIYDERDSSLVFTCYTISSCNQSKVIYRKNNESTMRFYAYLKDWNGSTIATAWSPYIAINSSISNATPVITSPYNGQVLTNFPRTMTITWNGTARRHQIEVSCGAACWPVVGQNSYTAYLTSDNYNNSINTTITGDDTISLRVRAINENGVYGDWSNMSSFRFTTSGYNNNNNYSYNNGVNYINGLVLNADRTSINAGTVVRLTANAYNAGTWNYTGNRIEISDINTGSIVKTCYDNSSCVVDVYPQAQSSTNLSAQYQAKIYDRNGTFVMSQYSPVIYITGYTGTNYNPVNNNQGTQTTGRGLVTFTPVENLRTNKILYVTATFTDTNVPTNDAVVTVYTEQSSTPIATCTASRTCSVSFSTGADPINTRVYARLSSTSNTYTTLDSNRADLVTTR